MVQTSIKLAAYYILTNAPACDQSFSYSGISIGVDLVLSSIVPFNASSTSTSTAATGITGSFVTGSSAPVASASCYGALYVQSLFDPFVNDPIGLLIPISLSWTLYVELFAGTPGNMTAEAASSLSGSQIVTLNIPLVDGFTSDAFGISCLERTASATQWTSGATCSKDTVASTGSLLVCHCTSIDVVGSFFGGGNVAIAPYFGNNGVQYTLPTGAKLGVFDISSMKDCIAYDAVLGAVPGYTVVLPTSAVSVAPLCCARKGMVDATSSPEVCNVARCNAPASPVSC
jgi:hypothetical protein